MMNEYFYSLTDGLIMLISFVGHKIKLAGKLTNWKFLTGLLGYLRIFWLAWNGNEATGK
jgi:hypothetical protein